MRNVLIGGGVALVIILILVGVFLWWFGRTWGQGG